MVEEKVSVVDAEEQSQRQPKESRAGRESTALNMARRVYWAMSEERGVEGTREEEKAKREGPKNQGYIGLRSQGKGSP